MTGNPFLTVGFTASPPHRAPPRPTRAQLCAQNPPRPSPSPSALLAVDEEFEAVSTQLLKRTQAMLNKYRLLLLEESRVRQGRRSQHVGALLAGCVGPRGAGAPADKGRKSLPGSAARAWHEAMLIAPRARREAAVCSELPVSGTGNSGRGRRARGLPEGGALLPRPVRSPALPPPALPSSSSSSSSRPAESQPFCRDGDDRPHVHPGGEDHAGARQAAGQGEARWAALSSASAPSWYEAHVMHVLYNCVPSGRPLQRPHGAQGRAAPSSVCLSIRPFPFTGL